MTKMTPTMRLKVNRDTFFLPDMAGRVYFRNNAGSFHMEGDSIDRWIEKLVPMFNGNYTMEELTAGLPEPYKRRVYEIAEALHQNGFVQDISSYKQHGLKEDTLTKYASQIGFLNSFGGSGAYRFEQYRKEKVLAIGSGPFFLSLINALLESGLPTFHVLVNEEVATNRKRLAELTSHARKTDPEVAIEVVTKAEAVRSWREVIDPFDTVYYVSQTGEVEELRVLHAVCRDEKKRFIPAVCFEKVGMAGPFVDPESDACWESAWRSLHQSAFVNEHPAGPYSSTVGALLANLCVFEGFKTMTGVSTTPNQLYTLDLFTLTGKWHTVRPHPRVTDCTSIVKVEQLDWKRNEDSDLFLAFGKLTSEVTGIFHRWEEGDLNQIPLSQCAVQVVDPISDGPADLLPVKNCSGLTHEEARKEAGLVGVEDYCGRLIDSFQPSYTSVGAGETAEEGISRGLQKCLLEKLNGHDEHSVVPVKLGDVTDDHCRFYLNVLEETRVFLGEDLSGYPVTWVNVGDSWYGSAGINETQALRSCLQKAILMDCHANAICAVNVTVNEADPRTLDVPQLEIDLSKLNETCDVYELKMEALFKQGELGVYGVLLREEAVE
ncbi:putative thiazole-containing bacteriocin maturation protein [Pseudalkalibacillus sp. SCS-8]|uniref:putative thiazole-containing bacteriocin maturation protein n=1 Tax=Pseudalkalibacillus nanhaiensis TaxID=3115291 RepID=UPI0032DA19A6